MAQGSRLVDQAKLGPSHQDNSTRKKETEKKAKPGGEITNAFPSGTGVGTVTILVQEPSRKEAMGNQAVLKTQPLPRKGMRELSDLGDGDTLLMGCTGRDFCCAGEQRERLETEPRVQPGIILPNVRHHTVVSKECDRALKTLMTDMEWSCMTGYGLCAGKADSKNSRGAPPTPPELNVLEKGVLKGEVKSHLLLQPMASNVGSQVSKKKHDSLNSVVRFGIIKLITDILYDAQ
ncbi:hypothetical protein WISP_132639 [Willisornis vidua]|uniref:Uncharacterized protein n=1 Tax=Willisornis vidua TaxID=1566151 RepID=A0ABQ9CP79_9PASS|nr:hypothetical protein WISP_132639 [Willisornis vidua]